MPDHQPSPASAMTTAEHPLVPQIRQALHRVEDPEIRRPITDLGMVDDVEVDADGAGPAYGAADRRRLPAEGHHRAATSPPRLCRVPA